MVIDATGKPGVAADFDLMAMEHGKHVVMMNVEADVTIGAYLKQEADRLGVVYSRRRRRRAVDCMELIEFASALGYRIVSAGKGKNNPLNHRRRARRLSRGSGAPQHEPAHAGRVRRRLQDHGRDGRPSPTPPGWCPTCPACTGPTADRDELAKVLIPREDGGILYRKGVVDYTIGKGVAPGVFVHRRGDASAHPRAHGRPEDRQGAVLQLLPALPPDQPGGAADGGAGPCSTQARHDAPLPQPVAEVARSPSAISAGETLRQIGEADYRGWTHDGQDARTQNAVPLGLAERAVVTQPIKAGELLTYANCRPDEKMKIVQLRQLQDQMLASIESTKTGS